MKGSAMSDHDQKDSASVSPTEERHGIQRRGLLAKTAAFVAGVVATQAVQPVAANPGDPIYTDRPASGSGTTSLTSSASDFALAVTNTSQSAATFPTAIVGVSRVSNGVGIKGFGVRHGVQGLIEAGNVSAGAIAVQGFCSGSGPDAEGVQGLIVGTGPNFSIQSDNNRAIEGTNYSIGNGLIGVLGTIANTPSSLASASTAISGNNYADAPNTIGVYGEAKQGNGVSGYSISGAGCVGTSLNSHGLVGVTKATDGGHAGLFGYTDQVNAIAVQGGGAVPGSYAAVFYGTTVVKGQFIIQGGGKSAAVPHADGTHRLVYCVESPESWFEDFGEGKLVNGKADVTLKSDFTDIVDTSDYHVFLTEYDDHNALFVTNRNKHGFEVHAKGSKDANGKFSYRIVVLRTDIKTERLAKFKLPKEMVKPDIKDHFKVRTTPPKLP